MQTPAPTRLFRQQSAHRVPCFGAHITHRARGATHTVTIDAHTRLWPDHLPWPLRRPPSNRWARFQEAMHCVDRAFVLASRADRLGIRIATADLAAFCAEAPDVRLPVPAIDPLSDSLADDLAEAAHHNAVAITIAPADTGARPTHDRFVQVLDWCAHRALPVHISNPFLEHTASTIDFARHALLDQVLPDFPNLHIILGDIAFVPLEETLLLLAKHDHVFAECSRIATKPWHLRHALTCAYEREVTSRLLIGSGFPFATPEQVIAAAYQVNALGTATGGAPIPREIIRAIVDRDALRCLDIDELLLTPLTTKPRTTTTLPARVTEPAA